MTSREDKRLKSRRGTRWCSSQKQMLFSGGGSYSVFFFITKGGFKLSTITEKTDEVFRTLKFNTQKNNWLKFWASTYSDCLSLLIPSILHIDAGNAWPLWKKKYFSISLIILDAKVLNEIPFDHKFYNFTCGWYCGYMEVIAQV